MTERSRVPSGAEHWESRITHCTQGHPYSGDNLIVYRGRRYCRQCRIDRGRASRSLDCYKRRKRPGPGERKTRPGPPTG